VVTAAHVVAGEQSTFVEPANDVPLGAEAVAFDPTNDVAVLRVAGLQARALRLVDPRPGTSVAILGYPGTSSLAALPGRIGATERISTNDAYGRGPVSRVVTSLRGRVRHGNSGGPAVDARGNVRTMVFAARIGSEGGFGIPAEVIRRDLARANHRVSTGGCAP
jgi:S1-C subfamily serine protease